MGARTFGAYHQTSAASRQCLRSTIPGVFFPAIPELKPLQIAPDFRLQRREPGPVEAHALEAVQEWAEAQRLNAISLYETIGEFAPSFPENLRFSIDDSPEIVAERVRLHLSFFVETQFAFKASERRTFPVLLRLLIESTGVLVLQQSGLRAARTRGICLYSDTLPVIVYGNEAPGGQVFTLSHEFGHVLLGKSAISGSPIIAYQRGSLQRRIEGWCNNFAAAFLMPAGAVRGHSQSPRKLETSIADDRLQLLANAFAVSKHAMLIRLVALGLVDPRFYWRKKRSEFLIQEASFVGEGRSKYYGSRFRNALGDHYTGLVLEAMETEKIGYHSAAEYMGIKKIRHLQDIKKHFEE